MQRLQAHLANRLSRAYPTDDPLAPSRTSMLDLRDPLYSSSVPLRKLKVFVLCGLTDSRICFKCHFRFFLDFPLQKLIYLFIYIENYLYHYSAVNHISIHKQDNQKVDKRHNFNTLTATETPSAQVLLFILRYLMMEIQF